MREKICGVYKFTHIPTGKCYVGSSIDCDDRKRIHLRTALKGGRSYFHRNLYKLGVDNFQFEIIERCAPEARLEREKHFISELNSACPNGFNLKEDPTLGWDYLFSPATCAAISEHHKGNKYSLGVKASDEARRRISEAGLGRIASIETRIKISQALKGKKCSESAKKKISAANTNPSLETRMKMSASKIGNTYTRGKKLSASHVEKIRMRMLGSKASEQTKKKMSEAKMGSRNNFFGRTHSEEFRKMMSLKFKGKSLSESHKKKLAIAMSKLPYEVRHRKLSPEHRLKIGENSRRRGAGGNMWKIHFERLSKNENNKSEQPT